MSIRGEVEQLKGLKPIGPDSLEQIKVGICTYSSIDGDMVKAVLNRNGFAPAKVIPPDTKQLKYAIKNIDIILILADTPTDQSLRLIHGLRMVKSPIDLPILYQKSPRTGDKIVNRLSHNINDFVKKPINENELVVRIKAHYDMVTAKNEFFNFYKDYQEEILQSQKTIEHLETIEPTEVINLSDRQKYRAVIKGTQTKPEKSGRLSVIEQKIEIPHGGGFTFTLNNERYFMFVSIKGGLAPVLILSFLKGFTESLKDEGNEINPSECIERAINYIEGILPHNRKLKIICAKWNRSNGSLIFHNHGRLIPIEYNHVNKSIKIYKHDVIQTSENKDRVYNVKSDTTFFLFDADLLIDLEQLKSHCIILDEKHSLTNLDRNDFRDQNGLPIPYFFISPSRKEYNE